MDLAKRLRHRAPLKARRAVGLSLFIRTCTPASAEAVAGATTPSTPGGQSALRRVITNRIVLVLLMSAAALRIMILVHDLPRYENRWDFSHYYAAALAMRQGIDPYVTDLTPEASRLGLELKQINRATYPPTFLVAFEPLTLLSPHAAYWTWFAINVIGLVAALWMLFRDFWGIDPFMAMALVALAMLYPPLWEHFRFAQCQILILVMLILIMRALRRGDERAAGLWLALATLLRVFPILLAGYFIARRRWRAIVYTVVGGAIGAVITIAFVGLGRSLDFRHAIGFVVSPFWLEHDGNLSAAAFLSHLYWHWGGLALPPALEIARIVTSRGVELALFAVSIFVTADAGSSEEQELAWLPLWIAAMIIVAPTAWLNYLVMLYLPFAVFLRAARAGRLSERASRMAIISYLIPLVEFVVAAWLYHRISPSETTLLRGTLIAAPLTAYLAAYWYAKDLPPSPSAGTHG